MPTEVVELFCRRNFWPMTLAFKIHLTHLLIGWNRWTDDYKRLETRLMSIIGS